MNASPVRIARLGSESLALYVFEFVTLSILRDAFHAWSASWTIDLLGQEQNDLHLFICDPDSHCGELNVETNSLLLDEGMFHLQ